MNERIKALCELTLSGKMYVEPVKTEFDRCDLFLNESEMNVKRLCEYILNQEPKITEYSCFTGLFNLSLALINSSFTFGTFLASFVLTSS